MRPSPITAAFAGITSLVLLISGCQLARPDLRDDVEGADVQVSNFRFSECSNDDSLYQTLQENGMVELVLGVVEERAVDVYLANEDRSLTSLLVANKNIKKDEAAPLDSIDGGTINAPFTWILLANVGQTPSSNTPGCRLFDFR